MGKYIVEEFVTLKKGPDVLKSDAIYEWQKVNTVEVTKGFDNFTEAKRAAGDLPGCFECFDKKARRAYRVTDTETNESWAVNPE